MKSIIIKEISSFFHSLTGYFVLGGFLLIMGLFMWVFRDTSILEGNYAGLDPLFVIAPMIFIFLVPAVTMRSISEELSDGTYQLLTTKPIALWQLILGKYIGNLLLLILALIPTLIYVYSVHTLGSPIGNLDMGATIGSYIGLFFLVAAFTAIGLFTSGLSENQVVAFLAGSILCFLMYWAFEFVSELPIFFGRWDDIVQRLGMSYHFNSISKGLIDSRDIIYFLSVILFFLYSTYISLLRRH